MKKEFSDTELIILDLMTKCLDNKQIAQKLFVSENTIKTHLSSIYAKMDIKEGTNVSKRTKAILMFLGHIKKRGKKNKR